MNGCFRLTLLLIVPLLCGGWFCVMSWFILMDHTAWSVVDITPLVAIIGAGVSAVAAALVVATRSQAVAGPSGQWDTKETRQARPGPQGRLPAGSSAVREVWPPETATPIPARRLPTRPATLPEEPGEIDRAPAGLPDGITGYEPMLSRSRRTR